MYEVKIQQELEVDWKAKERVVLRIPFSFLAVRFPFQQQADWIQVSETGYKFQYIGCEMSLTHPIDDVI